ncbi:MAG: TlpA family protein disulfide reductase [Cyclobacteriaceae bacterium]|nr:TlpA family protein disulfide reductase [Cyclobacteriaceae bacterium]
MNQRLIWLLLVVLLACSSTINGQQIELFIQTPPEFKTLELLSYENPFDDNVSLLAELKSNSEGTFEYSISTPNQLRVAFKLGEFSKDLILTSGYKYSIDLEIQKFEKPDLMGNQARLVVNKIESDNKEFTYILQVEKDIEAIGEKNKKSNGKLSDNYANELFDYWNTLLIENTNEYKVVLTNSRVYSNGLFYLKRLGTANQFKTLEAIFQKNFEPTVSGIRAMVNIYTTDLLMEYLTKHLREMSYLQFVDKAVSEIGNPKLKSALELSLVADAIGRKWADQNKVFERLQSYISTTSFTTLKQYAESIKALHESELMGKEIENFKSLATNGDTILFSDFKGKYLLIDFWATWCGPCVKSMRKLPDLKKEMNGKLEVLCITFEMDKEKVGRFIEKNNYKEALTFGFAINKKLMDSYFDIRAIPLYYLVSPDGVIVDKAVGEPFEMLKKHLK